MQPKRIIPQALAFLRRLFAAVFAFLHRLSVAFIVQFKRAIRTLTFWIFFALFFGILFGLFANQCATWASELQFSHPWMSKIFGFLGDSKATYLQQMGKLFIRLIKLIVAPLVFTSVVVGLNSAGSKHMGRLLFKAILWFWLATAVALTIGLATAHIFKPGKGAEKNTKLEYKAPPPPKPVIEQVIPDSFVAAMAENNLLQILCFSILFGVALAAVGPRGKPVLDVIDGVNETMFKVTKYVMYAAPIGVFGSIANTVRSNDTAQLKKLAMLVGSLYVALVIFIVLLLTALKLITRVRLGVLLKEIRSSLFLAFSTASSDTVLPRVIDSLERLGVPPRIVRLVIPTGYTMNLDGTTLYLSLAAMFIAQAAGIQLSIGQQITMMLTLLLTSKGVAAVPRASLIVLAATCGSFGLPSEWIATILGVDVLMDMARTSVNVLGNCTASIIVAKWENDLPQTSPLFTDTKAPPSDIL